MKAYIYPNLSKKNCLEYTLKACEILSGCGVELCFDSAYERKFSGLEADYLSEDQCIRECGVIIAVGGDGTILSIACAAAENGKPVLGINCGRLGFMASLEHSQLEDLRKIADGSFSYSKRMMLQVNADLGGGKRISCRALNDIVVSRADDCRIADFEVSKDGFVVSQLRANGVIFSTATGATAYSMSAGGPIIEPEMECIEFTQICPHSLFARSMIFSADSSIVVRCHANYESHLRVVADGNSICSLTDGNEITITRSPVSLDIIDINGGGFFSSVNDKLARPLKETAVDDL